MKTNKKIYLIWLLISFSISITLNIPIFAADIQIEGYVSGGLNLYFNGSWNGNLNHNEISYNTIQDQSSYWSSDPLIDYISFSDDTNTPGFHIKVSATDFAYTGNSTTQNNLPASNFTIYGEYDENGPAQITKGFNDSNLNLSILPNSCSNASPSNFNFHPDFSDQNTNYSLSLSHLNQTILESDLDCLNIGHIRFDRTEILIPAGSEPGNYNTTITITIFDGIPS